MVGRLLVLGSNASISICELCGAKDEELRPYGPNGENICYDCGMKNRETTDKKFSEFLDGRSNLASPEA